MLHSTLPRLSSSLVARKQAQRVVALSLRCRLSLSPSLSPLSPFSVLLLSSVLSLSLRTRGMAMECSNDDGMTTALEGRRYKNNGSPSTYYIHYYTSRRGFSDVEQRERESSYCCCCLCCSRALRRPRGLLCGTTTTTSTTGGTIQNGFTTLWLGCRLGCCCCCYLSSLSPHIKNVGPHSLREEGVVCVQCTVCV